MFLKMGFAWEGTPDMPCVDSAEIDIEHGAGTYIATCAQTKRNGFTWGRRAHQILSHRRRRWPRRRLRGGSRLKSGSATFRLTQELNEDLTRLTGEKHDYFYNFTNPRARAFFAGDAALRISDGP